MKKSLVLVFMLTPVFAWAQSISGTVADSNGQSIAFANVALCQSNDSTIIDGCTSNEDGKFNLTTDGLKGKYLRISFVGYKTKFIELSSSPLHVTLEPLMLDEVIIKNRRKLFEQKYGEITARVKGTILEASVPALGSVRPKAPIFLPESRSGRYFIFCSSVPCSKMGAQHREVWGETTTAVVPQTLASSSTHMA